MAYKEARPVIRHDLWGMAYTEAGSAMTDGEWPIWVLQALHPRVHEL